MNIKRMRELAEAKISSIMKDHLVMLAKGKQPGSDSTETMMRLTAMNLVTYEDREYTLTPEGAKLAQEVIGNKQKTQQVKNHNARNRHATMKSLGLTRTRSGAYESQGFEDVKRSLRPFVETLRDLLNLDEAGCPPGQIMVFGKCQEPRSASSANDQDKDFDCPSGQRRVGGRCLPAKEADAQDAENKAKHAASRERLKQIDAKDKRAKELAARVKAAGFTPH